MYAHNNQIRSLRDSLQHCKFLNTLIVSNNRITDMKETVEDLAGFQYLHELGTCQHSAVLGMSCLHRHWLTYLCMFCPHSWSQSSLGTLLLRSLATDCMSFTNYPRCTCSIAML